MKYLVAPFAGLGWLVGTAFSALRGEGAQLELPGLGALLSLFQAAGRVGAALRLRLGKCRREEGGGDRPGCDLLAGAVPRAGCQALRNGHQQPLEGHETGVCTALESAPTVSIHRAAAGS